MENLDDYREQLETLKLSVERDLKEIKSIKNFSDGSNKLKLIRGNIKHMEENLKLFKQNICLAPIAQESALLDQFERYKEMISEY